MTNQPIGPERSEVMNFIGRDVEAIAQEYLKPIETNWQASELLPLTSDSTFVADLKSIQEEALNHSYDLMVVLVADTITEEALPTYESWLSNLVGVDQQNNNGWMKWMRSWAAEENRHGDVLNRYLYLCGRVNMREFEASTQYLIADGFNNMAGNDPYRNFVYTSFQELATNISHRRVATLAKKDGNNLLSKLCGLVAADEARHARAYQNFVTRIFELDPNEMMLAFEDMMRKKIVMPAQCMRELGGKLNTFSNFSDAATRLGVYTSMDYIDILREVIGNWQIENINGLKENGEKARDYLLALPDRLTRIAERAATPKVEHKFGWILA
ncbi:MAG: acyl-ACP desaturase [Bacteroidetes bacterium B1(2017)]|nr:MAG: acyl-ACP desaturase [Bacteroidetes bacterium B1(2017)]